MNSRKTKFLLVISLLLFCNVDFAATTDISASMRKPLRIYMLREVTVNESLLTLDRISVLAGPDSLVAKAGALVLGRMSVPGQEFVIDRYTLLSRLVSNGIDKNNIKITGAEKIIVKQQSQVIEKSRLIQAAKDFLKENPPHHAICKFDILTKPKDLVLPGLKKGIELKVALVSTDTTLVKVNLTAIVGEKKIPAGQISFRPKYTCRNIVVTKTLLPGTIVTPKNVKIEKVVSNRPEPLGWKEPYGLVCKRRLLAGTILRDSMINLPEPPVVVKRNKIVIIRIDRIGLLITTHGMAMQEGRVGEFIKVKNIDSERIIVAKVNEDGTVTPGS